MPWWSAALPSDCCTTASSASGRCPTRRITVRSAELADAAAAVAGTRWHEPPLAGLDRGRVGGTRSLSRWGSRSRTHPARATSWSVPARMESRGLGARGRGAGPRTPWRSSGRTARGSTGRGWWTTRRAGGSRRSCTWALRTCATSFSAPIPERVVNTLQNAGDALRCRPASALSRPRVRRSLSLSATPAHVVPENPEGATANAFTSLLRLSRWILRCSTTESSVATDSVLTGAQ